MSDRSRWQSEESFEVPQTPLIDIIFILIIFFLVATSLVRVKSISADLPTGEKKAQAQTDKTPIVNLRGAEIFFNDKSVTLENLHERLAALELAKAAPEKRVIMLESTKGTNYDTYFQALAAISANGGVVALVEEEE